MRYKVSRKLHHSQLRLSLHFRHSLIRPSNHPFTDGEAGCPLRPTEPTRKQNTRHRHNNTTTRSDEDPPPSASELSTQYRLLPLPHHSHSSLSGSCLAILDCSGATPIQIRPTNWIRVTPPSSCSWTCLYRYHRDVQRHNPRQRGFFSSLLRVSNERLNLKRFSAFCHSHIRRTDRYYTDSSINSIH